MDRGRDAASIDVACGLEVSASLRELSLQRGPKLARSGLGNLRVEAPQIDLESFDPDAAGHRLAPSVATSEAYRPNCSGLEGRSSLSYSRWTARMIESIV